MKSSAPHAENKSLFLCIVCYVDQTNQFPLFKKMKFCMVCVDQVTSTHGNTFHYADNVHEGHFAFETTEAGDYMACFYAADHKPPVTMTINFDWKSGVAAKDWTNVAKKGSIDVSLLSSS